MRDQTADGWTRTDMDAQGIVTTGRLSFALTDQLIHLHAVELQIPIVHKIGLFWEQELSNAIETVLAQAEPPKYILFFDGDGAWTAEDVRELYRIIDTETVDGRPIDAVYPTQAARGGNVPLAFNWEPQLMGLPCFNYEQALTREIHGHFGLTFVRTSLFAKTPKPWFWSHPSATGSWRQREGKVDADTYFWAKVGSTDPSEGAVCVRANHVVIGHMELGIRWQVGRDVVVQSINDFLAFGKPKGTATPNVADYEPAEIKRSIPYLAQPFTGPPESGAEA